MRSKGEAPHDGHLQFGCVGGEGRGEKERGLEKGEGGLGEESVGWEALEEWLEAVRRGGVVGEGRW